MCEFIFLNKVLLKQKIIEQSLSMSVASLSSCVIVYNNPDSRMIDEHLKLFSNHY